MRTTVAFAASLLLFASPRAFAIGGHRAGEREVTIVRDERGVPHVHSGDLRALFYGVGYAQGQDRLWQAETLRRAATGTLAEWFGPGSVDSDVQARLLLGPQSRRAALVDSASRDTKTVLQAFADGMNAWIAEATASGALPLEYAAFGVAPRPWTVDDTLAIDMLLGSQFGWFGSDELDNAKAYADLVARLGPEEGARAFADTHFLEDPSAPTTDPRPGHGRPHRVPEAKVRLPDRIGEAAEGYRDRSERQRKALDEIGIHRGPMSNAILLGPRMSADGKPLLLGGPQMGYSAPQINHEMGLHGAGFDVTGMEIAGWPLLPIGVGRDYAWSLTSGGSDNSDIFALQLNPVSPLQYRYRGTWKDLDCRQEVFGIRGAAPLTQTLCVSAYGPVVAAAGDTAYAFANSTFGEEMTTYEAWLGMGTVRSFREFRDRVAGVALNFNVFYADARGNIAHFHAGKIPIRARGANPFFPQPGDGSSDWQGIVPFEQMPHSINPERGWLVNWNNKPGPDWPNSSAGFWDWGPVHRVNTLRGLVAKLPARSATLATLAAINRTAGLTTDSPSGSADTVVVSTMLGKMLDAVDTSADARLPQAVALLRGWNWLQTDEDGDGKYDSPSVAVFNTWWEKSVASVVTPALGPAADSTICAQVLYRLLQGKDAALPLQADYLRGRTIGAALTASLVDALDALTAQYASPDVGTWLQKRAEIFWRPGGIGSVPNTLWMNRGTYNQLVHLGHGDDLQAMNVIAPGQSGDFRSPHFADQLPLYQTWTYKPMRLGLEDQLRHAESVTRLLVPR
ncbi:MAG TPA: penicillin acylase family protein [Anaeromyxobacteraceae bacterium]|nr:penicillin acylase family protein [Anaeromyxobacteraceae bacterium]